MVDLLRFYALETYLFEDVRSRFGLEGSLGAFDFFAIVMWKANRAKSIIAKLLRRMDPGKRIALEPIVRDLTGSLRRASDDKERMRVLVQKWGFRLPMATAILSVLWPKEFTVYDVRVCQELKGFERLTNLVRFDRVWTGYCEYREAVQASVRTTMSIRDKDRFLWASSVARQLEADIASGFGIKSK